MAQLCGILLAIFFFCCARTVWGIIGGSFAPSGYRYMVSFQTIPARKHFCGGAIISNKWIISAAECFQEKTDLNHTISVVGCNDLDPKKCTEETYDIAKLVMHPNYSFPHNNLALIKPKKKIKFNTTDPITTIQLADSKLDLSGNLDLPGWGRHDLDEAINPSGHLKHLKLHMISNEDCQGLLQKTDWEQITVTDMLLCAVAKEPKTGGCAGDEGGPLIKGTDMVGILCMINKTCVVDDEEVHTPMVFTRVSAYSEFINSTMTKDAEEEKKKAAKRSGSQPLTYDCALTIICVVALLERIVK